MYEIFTLLMHFKATSCDLLFGHLSWRICD